LAFKVAVPDLWVKQENSLSRLHRTTAGVLSTNALNIPERTTTLMTAENTSQAVDLNEETRHIWDQNAAFWDEKMGDGNDFQRLLVAPASERLLNLQPGETVLEIACGNGVFARRMAQLGVHVIATDFSEQLLERARARTTEYADRIEYQFLDATREDQIIALGKQRFDAAVCNQAIMDMAEIDPLMRGIRQVVKPGGRFVFSLLHPCFNHSGIARCAEDATINGEVVTTYSIKVTKYLHSSPQKGVAMIGQPVPHYYFDRPLHVLFSACFRAGLVLDGLEEPAFNHPHDGSKIGSMPISWTHFKDIPPEMVVRLRIPG
jgi:2-polyprenyl-3-methyl-5-hydroxy-6-metoxy-1,4-benzoquinol methylase